jgi:hypothetical protein
MIYKQASNMFTLMSYLYKIVRSSLKFVIETFSCHKYVVLNNDKTYPLVKEYK